MIHSVGMSNQSYHASMVSQQSPVAGKQGAEELTTVTTHCNKNHKHTPACPHMTFTRPEEEGKGKYLDMLV